MSTDQALSFRGTVTSVRSLLVGTLVLACLLVGGVQVAAAAGTPVELSVSQQTASTVLGHSCGGIQEQSIAQGFDGVSGNPIGVVYAQTRCGGSGRGGGYHVTTYSAWLAVIWDFGANTISYTTLAAPPAGLAPAATYTDVHGDQMYTTYSSATSCPITINTTCAYHAWMSVTPPNAPSGVQATLTNGQYSISWTPDPATAEVITGSTITLTPDGGTAVIVAPVAGNATNATVGPLAPLTTYSIVVTNTDAAGTSPASDPIQITTGPATTKPSLPRGIAARWLGSNLLYVSWNAPARPGDSIVDQYQVKASVHDGDVGAPGTLVISVDGSTLAAQLTVDDSYDWAVRVRAHNVAGWSAWTTRVIVAALN
jgi:Fibronectin type III domain